MTETPSVLEQENKKDKTTIPIKKSTRDRIKGYGKKGESWDILMNRVMNEVEKVVN